MKTIRFIFFIALALPFYGCNPCQYYARRCAPVEARVDSIWSHDTTFIERIITDTVEIVTLPAERVTNTVISPDTAKAETSLAFAWAFLQNGCLQLRLANKPAAPLPVTKVTERSNKNSVTGHQTTVTHKVTEYRTKPFIQFLAWTGALALLLLVVYIAFKIGRYFVKR